MEEMSLLGFEHAPQIAQAALAVSAQLLSAYILWLLPQPRNLPSQLPFPVCQADGIGLVLRPCLPSALGRYHTVGISGTVTAA